jgi:hypothetical protein
MVPGTKLVLKARLERQSLHRPPLATEADGVPPWVTYGTRLKRLGRGCPSNWLEVKGATPGVVGSSDPWRAKLNSRVT